MPIWYSLHDPIVTKGFCWPDTMLECLVPKYFIELYRESHSESIGNDTYNIIDCYLGIKDDSYKLYENKQL